MVAVTAKVQVSAKTQSGPDAFSLSFQPDYADGRNAEWAAFTPHLSLSMTVKREVADHFELNGRYTLTFTPSED
jgi:hypothetical protein